MSENSMINWFTKHIDTVSVLATLIAGLMWMNGKFNDIDKRFSEIEKDLAVIKTIMVMKNIMPAELAKYNEKE